MNELGSFTCHQSWDMGKIIWLPLQRKTCWGFFRPKKSVGFGPELTARPPKPLGVTVSADTFYCVIIPKVMTQGERKSTANRPKGSQGSRGIALLFLDLSTGRGEGSAPCPRHLTPRKEPVSNVQEAGWAQEPVWTCAKNIAPTGIRSPDSPACSQPLCRLSYPGPNGTSEDIIT
jgi:hypothetical protein